VFVGSEHDKVQYELQSAITWIREDNHREAEHALREVSKRAHKGGFARLEAEAYRIRAMCEVDYKGALKSLQAAQQALEEHSLSRSDHDDELALILQAKVLRAAAEGDTSTSAVVSAELESMAESSRSQVVQLSWHVAAGTLLAAESKYPEAIAHLEDAGESPLALQLLWQLYGKKGATSAAEAMATRLAGLNMPTIEQALVVPKFRASLLSQAQQP
jgi:tetratricopeptide (TPR) repeat protein